jgi:MOSC domain-containing protein YiiM
MTGLGTTALEEGLDAVRAASADGGTVEMIVRGPAVDAREAVTSARIERGSGLKGDTRAARPHPKAYSEITLMSARAAALLSDGDRDRWPLAGDQLYVDLDLSHANLPVGSRLRVGTALLEVSEKPQTGCTEFSARFGDEALAFVNFDEGKALRLRGMNCSVVEAGVVRTGDRVAKAWPGAIRSSTAGCRAI